MANSFSARPRRSFEEGGTLKFLAGGNMTSQQSDTLIKLAQKNAEFYVNLKDYTGQMRDKAYDAFFHGFLDGASDTYVRIVAETKDIKKGVTAPTIETATPVANFDGLL